MRLVIFDCDGTLVDSQHAIVAAMAQAFAGADLPPPARADALAVVGLSLPQAMARLAPHVPEAGRQSLIVGYKRAYGALRLDPDASEPLYDGARETIAVLHARAGLSLGIATGKSRRGMAHILAREGWEGQFATVQTADDAPSKPHPAMIDQAIAETGAHRTQTVMIGDTSFDMAMARAAGVTAIGVAWGYHPPRALFEAGASLVADDFAHLLCLIDQELGHD